LLEENKEQKAKAAAEKQQRTQTKELSLASVAWEILFMKRLGFTKDHGRDCTVKEVNTFAAANIPDFQIHIKKDKDGKKKKTRDDGGADVFCPCPAT